MKANTKPKAVLMDFHRTLTFDLFWETLPEYTGRINDFLFVEPSQTANLWLRGKISAEDVTEIVADEFRLSYDFLWETLADECARRSFVNGILPKLSQLRQTIPVAMVTDNMDVLERFTVPRLMLDKFFSSIVSSHQLGFLKLEREGQFFFEAAERIGVPITNCLLFDDSPETCDLFRTIGGQAQQVFPDTDLAGHIQSLLRV
ncbi:MAG: hypothetical protein COV70_03720 [Parcubacteria group bacterium CG11_big_fil_rev_8_21_14_0_20_39_22]|nr:MAG: hypothetical protein COV70_03720 [Parcubacteria group bacterium CG11_big_fil_rev_8_21_14_0_20_39_22]